MESNTFHPVRRKDRILDEARILELLETSEYGYLSLGTGENGYAYGVPMSYAYDRKENALYFHCAPEGHKSDNLQRTDKVSFCVVGHTRPVGEKFTTLYESVIVFGTADIQPSDEDKRKALRKLVQKYSPEHIETGEAYMEKSLRQTHTFKVSIDRMTGKCRK